MTPSQKPKRPDLTTTRSPLREKRKTAGLSRNFLLLVVLVVVVSAAGLIITTSRKPAAAKAKAGAKRVAREVGEQAAGVKRSGKRSLAARAEKKQRAKPAKEKKKRERKQRVSRRGRRRGSGGIARGGYAVPRQLQMIVTGTDGERLAVVDNKQYKNGDEVEGRKLTQVGNDQVTVEYKGKTYTVRVGQQLY